MIGKRVIDTRKMRIVVVSEHHELALYALSGFNGLLRVIPARIDHFIASMRCP